MVFKNTEMYSGDKEMLILPNALWQDIKNLILYTYQTFV